MLILVPQQASKKRITQQLDDRKQTYKEMLDASKPSSLSQLRVHVESLEDKVGSYVVESNDLAGLTFDVSRIAGDGQVSAFSIKSKGGWKGAEVPACNRLSANHIDVRFTGSFLQFATFLNMLERHRPLVLVDRFEIKRSKDDGFSHKVNMDLAVLVKSQPVG
jgi:hypothetical protein